MILDQKLELMDDDQNPTESLNLEELKEALLTHICTENKAFFKSQQRDEAELNYNDRKEIASSILETSHSKFLQRFGMNLKKEHLKFFESQSYMNENEKCEVTESVKHICWNLEHHTTIIRNRRYAALLKLIRDKKYFSENEMRSRDPLLYEQLIGQYQSPAEKRANRRPDAKTDTLVDVLLEGIDYDLNKEMEKKQRNEEEIMQQNEDSQTSVESMKFNSDDNDDADDDDDHTHWGNFENVQQSSTATSGMKAKKRPAHLITAGERDLLREEFLGIMYSNFLSGKDSEFFDYDTVDKNEEYDDTLEVEQDFEDKYFEGDDSNDSSIADENQEINEESEDELDIYMKHLENNLKREENEKFHEEFDE